MFLPRTPLQYWVICPILGGPGQWWLGVIVWAVIGAVITGGLFYARHRATLLGVLVGAATGAIGGALLLSPLWFFLVSLLDRRCAGCGAKVAPTGGSCTHCGHEFREPSWAETLVGVAHNTGRVIVTIEMALIVGGLILELSGKDPLETYRVLFEQGLGTEVKRANALLAATPIIFTGLGTALAFRMGIFNLGVEGSLYMGALGAAWVGFTFVDWPGPVMIVVAFLFAMLVGGLWCLIPGYLKARLRVDEVVTTIMLNYVAIEFTSYMVQSGPFFVPGKSNGMSEGIASQAQLPRLVARSQLNASFIVALVCVVVVIFIMRRLTLGYELRMVGDNPLFARWSGIPLGKSILKVMFLSGLLGGMAGAGQVMGVHYNFTARFSRGYGFDGMTMALLGRNSPLGILIGALLFGVLRSGSTTVEMFTDVPIDLVDILQALIIFFVAVDLNVDFLRRRRAASLGTPPQAPRDETGQAAASVAA